MFRDLWGVPIFPGIVGGTPVAGTASYNGIAW
jgi:hypothetical protein